MTKKEVSKLKANKMKNIDSILISIIVLVIIMNGASDKNSYVLAFPIGLLYIIFRDAIQKYLIKV